MKFILSFILVIHFTGYALARDAIVYHERSSSKIFAATVDGFRPRVIQNAAIGFTVSPGADKMMVFHNGCIDKDTCWLTLYDLKKATARTVESSHADWLSGKWISNETFYVTREVRSDNGGRACGEGDELNGCAARAILQIARFDLASGNLSIVKVLGIGDYAALNNEFPREREAVPAISYDSRHALIWIGSDYWSQALVVRENHTGHELKLFQRKPRDFAEYYHYTKMPWSPDSKSFVMEYYPGGFFYTVFSGKKKIVVIDRASFHKRIIDQGWQPYWLPNFPDTFNRLP
ncbi:MAG: hypothetical protein JW943_13165 [Deltaproteobacteria bacterium]|nr:hypothetical protein [Deltaproteobacteria bacterium]